MSDFVEIATFDAYQDRMDNVINHLNNDISELQYKIRELESDIEFKLKSLSR
ncbi:MAG: hypothetical protein ACE5HX_05050 [bacterium]